MRLFALALLLACAACADDRALPTTSEGDATWALNRGKWEEGANQITAPPDANATPAADPFAARGGSGL